jgi:hypothetical protein
VGDQCGRESAFVKQRESSKAGNATFLPLSQINARNRDGPENAPNGDGVL